jgi:hypothetical protein
VTAAVEQQQGSWPRKWITKLGSKRADEVMIRGDRVQQKQGALTTVLQQWQHRLLSKKDPGSVR